MMMPANFSAISENEMTYVNGGASLSDILAPSLTLENWKKFNTNMPSGCAYIVGTSGREAFGYKKSIFKNRSSYADV